MKYSKENSIILKLNEEDQNGNCPLLNAIKNNNIEMVQLLVEYAKENCINLKKIEGDIKYAKENDNPNLFELLNSYTDIFTKKKKKLNYYFIN